MRNQKINMKTISFQPKVINLLSLLCLFALVNLSVIGSLKAQSLKTSSQGSELLSQSGETKVGEKLPFFSGWDIMTDRVVTTKNLFSQGYQQYVIALCASWCEPCKRGLNKLAKNRENLEANKIKVILLTSSDPKAKAIELVKSLGLEKFTTVADEFNTHTPKYSTLDNNQITLPRTIITDQNGIVTKIIGAEGDDYISLIMGRGH
jgi:thiol-disulfide isomerase/thioredoxin